MKTMRMKYPGDPPCTVEEMTLGEFFERFPPETRKIEVGPPGGPPDVSIPLGREVMCDFCNEHVEGGPLYLVRNSQAYCPECFKANLARHCR